MDGYSTLTSKGQATIPLPLRDFLGLSAGDQIYLEADTKQKIVKIQKAKSISWVDRLAGSLKTNLPYEPIDVVRHKAGILLGKKYSLIK